MTAAPAGLAGLFISAFLSATLLPGNSEVAMLLWLRARPDTLWLAVLVASLGNTLGSLSTFALAWRLSRNASADAGGRLSPRALAWLRRHGSLALLLAWLPIVGDGLCFAAGWLRLPAWSAGLAILAGKTFRYILIGAPWWAG
ncbi:DedA family protein [Chitinimonas arctica]|uniref:DedA family protein n=1 Tax=Chitinimonas arctica TaxID=2594795 RepID=A0A516SMH2_9NEIS|nr:DedA family protein [Chitinimonas arctica]